MNGQRDGIEQPVKKIVDNTFMLAFARLFMPIALATIGFFMITTLNDVKSSVIQTQSAIQRLTAAQQSQAVDIAKVQVKVDDTTDKIKDLAAQLADIQAKVQGIKQN